MAADVLTRKSSAVTAARDSDLVNALAQRGPEALRLVVSELMTRTVITCGLSDRVDGALARMTTRRIRQLPVVENGQHAGTASIGDLVHRRLNGTELDASVLRDITRMHG